MTRVTIKTVDAARPEQTITWNGTLTDVVYTDKTKIVFINTPTFGHILFMDGAVQSSAYDQEMYHNTLVLPAARLLPSNYTAIVLGGGEGCTSATAFSSGAATVTQIDHDGEAVDWASRMLSHWNRGVYYDPRLNLVIDDAFDVVNSATVPTKDSKRSDLIVVDLFDPDASTLRQYIYLISSAITKWLSPSGALVAYFGLWPNIDINIDSIKRELNVMCGDSYVVRGYVRYIPCFCAECLFLLIVPKEKAGTVRLEDGCRWVF